jgi:DtxR family Mn-dependent transcriptional regulator
VIEAYLSIALGYAWDRVHDEAEQLEHAASDELIDRMAIAIGEPVVDPHGAPIPSREGTIVEREYHSLADVSAGYSARVVRVSDDDPRMLRYLAELSIIPGAEVTLVSREPFGGPITVSISAVQTVIGPSLAAQVLVEPLPHEDQPAY